jgi:hypothetical protein
MLLLHQPLQHGAAPTAGFWLYWEEYTVIVCSKGLLCAAVRWENIGGAEFRACFMNPEIC